MRRNGSGILGKTPKSREVNARKSGSRGTSGLKMKSFSVKKWPKIKKAVKYVVRKSHHVVFKLSPHGLQSCHHVFSKAVTTCHISCHHISAVTTCFWSCYHVVIEVIKLSFFQPTSPKTVCLRDFRSRILGLRSALKRIASRSDINSRVGFQGGITLISLAKETSPQHVWSEIFYRRNKPISLVSDLTLISHPWSS